MVLRGGSSTTRIWIVVLCLILDQPVVDPITELFFSREDQRIHFEADSLFNLKDPGNLLKFLDQEEHVKNLRSSEASLSDLRARLDELMNRDDDVDVEKLFLRTEPDCLRAGDLYKKLNLLESVVLSLEAKGFRTEEFINTLRVRVPISRPAPDCSQIIDADSTVGLLKQLKGYQQGKGLRIAPEADIIAVVTAGLTPDEYGTSVASALKQNRTSWILFNMATFFYRIAGDANLAMECARRALHYSPKQHRDIALLNMASLLFRGDYPRDALAMAAMALDMGGDTVATYTLMGFMFASLSKFDESIQSFGNAIKVSRQTSSRMEAKLQDYQYAIKCHAKVHKGLSDQHENLKEVIRHFEVIGETTKKMEQLVAAILESKRSSAEGLLRTYGSTFRDSPSRTFELDGSYSTVQSLNKWKAPTKTWNLTLSLLQSSSLPKFNNVFISDFDYHFLTPDWPTPEECLHHFSKENIYQKPQSVLMLLENKGFEFWKVVGPLSAPAGFPLPYCESSYSFRISAELILATVEATQQDDSIIFPDKDAVKVISDYMGTCGALDEFGRKLSLAFILGILPHYMYYNMAAIYWRAVGATTRAAECLTRAYYFVPAQYKDLVLINMASFFTFVNQTESALAMVKEAVDVSALEPATLYAMGNILGAHGFYSLAVKNYRLTLTQDASFYPAMEALRRYRCAQRADGESEKTFSPEKLLENFGEGIFEIGITKMGMQIIKRTSETNSKGDASESFEFYKRFKMSSDSTASKSSSKK